MNFFKFLLYSSFIIFLYFRLKSGPYIYQSSNKYYVNIDKHKFEIDNLKIKRGDTIIFVNKDQIRHTIKTENEYIENSPILYQYDTWEITFNEPNKEIIFESSLYGNMNKLLVEVEDIFKDSNAEKEFRNNLINLKKLVNIQKDNIISKVSNSDLKKSLENNLSYYSKVVYDNRENISKNLINYIKPKSLIDIDIGTVNI